MVWLVIEFDIKVRSYPLPLNKKLKYFALPVPIIEQKTVDSDNKLHSDVFVTITFVQPMMIIIIIPNDRYIILHVLNTITPTTYWL